MPKKSKQPELQLKELEIAPFANNEYGKTDYLDRKKKIEKTNERLHKTKLFMSVSIPTSIALLLFTLFIFVRYGLGV